MACVPLNPKKSGRPEFRRLAKRVNIDESASVKQVQDAGWYLRSMNDLGALVLALRRRECHDRAARLNEHVLPPIKHVGHRRGAPDRRAGAIGPEVLPTRALFRTNLLAYVIPARSY